MISLNSLKDWFEKETESSVKKIRGEIVKRIDAVKSSMNELEIAAKDFEIGDTIDAETRSSQNIYEKMTEMVNEFEYPEKVTYKTAEEFTKTLEKFLEKVMTLGRRFIPNLKRKYKTRVFILNRALQRIQRNYLDLKEFLEQKTELLQEVDNTSDMIDTMLEKMNLRNNLRKQIEEESEASNKIKAKIDSLHNDTSSLESREILTELSNINKDVQIVGNKLRLELSGLDKPLRKLTSRAQDGKIMVPPELVQIANILRENPLDALWDLSEGHDKLNRLMEILIDASKNDKIQLKASMKNKAISLAEEIRNGSIKELHNELLVLKDKKKQIENNLEESGLKEQIQEFKEKEELLEKDRDIIGRRINSLKQEIETLNDEISKLSSDTQKQVKKLTQQEVKINIKE